MARLVQAFTGFVSQNRAKLAKWLAAGLGFMALSTGILYLLVDRLGLSVPVGTFVTAEISTILRFVVNHYWVFGLRNPTFKDCVNYHVANAGAFALWWLTANVFTMLGMHYLLASVAAVAGSTLFSLSTNFFWIWRKRHPGA